jgi:hypothetical protein
MQAVLNLHTLCEWTLLSKTEKMNIYQTGSRVYGTSSPTSDYDFFIVVTDQYFCELDDIYTNSRIDHPFQTQWRCYTDGDDVIEQTTLGYKCLYMDVDDISININLYSETVFRKKIDSNWLQALMVIFLPPQHIWRLDITKGIEASQVVVCMRKLIFTVISESGRHWDLAQRGWSNNANFVQLKKYMVHCFRDILFGMQIVERGTIYDYAAANDIYHEILSDTATDWKFYYSKYYPRLQHLKDKFNEVTDREMLIGVLPNLESRKFGTSCTMDFTRKKGSLESLYRLLSIEIVQHPNHEQLWHLSSTELSPHASSVVLEIGHGMMIAQINDIFEIVSMSVPKVLQYTDHYIPKIDYKKGIPIVNIKRDELSRIVTLYDFHGVWYLYSNNSPIASESIGTSALDTVFWSWFTDQEIERDISYTFLVEQTVDDATAFNISLIAALDRGTLQEVDYLECAAKHRWRTNEINVRIRSQLEVLNYVCSLDPYEYKEAWICDHNHRRIAFMAPQFESYNKLVSRTYSKDEVEYLMLDVIRAVCNDHNRVERIRNKFDQNLGSVLEAMQQKYARLCTFFDTTYQTLAEAKDQKAFVEAEAKLVLEDFSTLENIRAYMKMIFLQFRNGKKNTPDGVQISNCYEFFSQCENSRVYSIYKSFA